MKRPIIRTEDLYPGARVVLYSWQTDGLEAPTKRHGVVEKILRNGRMIIIRMDHGYTECWRPKELFLALNGIRQYSGYVSPSTVQEVRNLVSGDSRAMEDMIAHEGVREVSNGRPGGVSGWNIPMRSADDDTDKTDDI
jgi:hypothetical protein